MGRAAYSTFSEGTRKGSLQRAKGSVGCSPQSGDVALRHSSAIMETRTKELGRGRPLSQHSSRNSSATTNYKQAMPDPFVG